VKPLLLIGGGGHCRACIDVIEATGEYSIRGIIERGGAGTREVLGHPVIGSDDDLPALSSTAKYALVTVGQLPAPELRMGLVSRALNAGLELATVVSPRAQISRYASIGAGTIVMHGAAVGPGAHVGAHCIVNSLALIEHDSTIGDFCHISTGAIVNGGTQVEDGCFIGSGAVVFQGLRIGSGSVVGAGCVVRADLPKQTRYLEAR
jgi:sugar O-acyltransferase (sialic acid O-acetyltransferase NeuD family)